MPETGMLVAPRDDDRIAQTGRDIYERLRSQLEQLPAGSHVVIDVATGAFVAGPSLSEACDAFESKFGDVPSYVRRIGQPIRV